MHLPTLFSNFHLEKISLNVMGVGLALDVDFSDDDQDAAWELYIEMLTRIVTQPLPSRTGTNRPRWTAFIPCSRRLGRSCAGGDEAPSSSAR